MSAESLRACQVVRDGQWVDLDNGLASCHVGDVVRMFEPDGSPACDPFLVMTEPVPGDGLGFVVQTDPDAEFDVPAEAVAG